VLPAQLGCKLIRSAPSAVSLALKIEAEFPNLDDGTIIGSVEYVHKVFELIQREKNEMAEQSKFKS